jgi:hypothetical protein
VPLGLERDSTSQVLDQVGVIDPIAEQRSELIAVVLAETEIEGSIDGETNPIAGLAEVL